MLSPIHNPLECKSGPERDQKCGNQQGRRDIAATPFQPACETSMIANVAPAGLIPMASAKANEANALPVQR